MWGNSWLGEGLLATQEGLCFMELVNKLFTPLNYSFIHSFNHLLYIYLWVQVAFKCWKPTTESYPKSTEDSLSFYSYLLLYITQTEPRTGHQNVLLGHWICSWMRNGNVAWKPIASEVLVGAIHPQVICKTSKTTMLISLWKTCTTLLHPRVASVELPRLETTYFQKCRYMQHVLCNVTEYIM